MRHSSQRRGATQSSRARNPRGQNTLMRKEGDVCPDIAVHPLAFFKKHRQTLLSPPPLPPHSPTANPAPDSIGSDPFYCSFEILARFLYQGLPGRLQPVIICGLKHVPSMVHGFCPQIAKKILPGTGSLPDIPAGPPKASVGATIELQRRRTEPCR